MPSAVEVVDRGAEADRLGDHRRARLELPRQLVPGRAAAKSTEAIMSPPVRNGGISLEQLARGRAARRCRSGRAPCGRSRRRSRRRAPRRRPASAAPPGRRRSATARPAARARAAISATGLIVPSTLETCANGDQPHVAAGELGVELLERQLAVLVDLAGSAASRRARGRAPARARCSRGAPSA